MNLFRSLLAVGFALGVFAGPVRGQDSTRFNVYLHGVLGTGLTFLSSPDIDNLMARTKSMEDRAGTASSASRWGSGRSPKSSTGWT